MRNQRGFIGISFTLLAVLVLAGMGASALILTMSQQRLVRNTEQSLRAYYGAEAGAEDVLLRLVKGWNISSPVTLGVLSSTVSTTVTDTAEGKQVAAQGDDNSRIRRVEAVFALDSTNPQFFWGAHVGEGGLIMDNNSRVEGSVFSNGSIQGSSGAIIRNSAIVAGSGNSIEDVKVEEDVTADECESAEVTGILYTNDNDGCSFGSLEPLGTPPDPVPLPVSLEDIQGWKDEAEAGGVTVGGVQLDGNDTFSLGPQKIVGDLEMQNNAILTVTGTLWVTGKIDIKNEAQVRLDSSYGATSGVLVADGKITLQNNSRSEGSGTGGSYLMYVTTLSGNAALEVKNNAIADIVYANAGEITVGNNTQLKEIAGYAVRAQNNAVVVYEQGLQDAFFSSGPGAGWVLKSWKEVE